MRLHGQILTALPVFEAAAKLGSFSEAARHLSISRGAVSQQIKKLELQLGLSLFIRNQQRVQLTDQGELLLSVVSRSLSSIERCILVLQQSNRSVDEDVLRVRATPSITSQWLMPRLKDFQQQYPLINVEIFSDTDVIDLDRPDFDLAIDYAPPQKFYGYETLKLFDEQLIPVMAASYLSKFDWQQQKSWHQAVLLHDAQPWRGAARDEEWRYWFSSQGNHINTVLAGHFFNRADMAIEAAAAGVGVALARMAIISDSLASGRLVAPLPAVGSCCKYYLIRPESQPRTEAVTALIRWLLQQDQLLGYGSTGSSDVSLTSSITI